MIDPQDSPTQEVDGVLRGTRTMESGVSTDETRDSHNQIQIMYIETNNLADTIECVKTEDAVEVIHPDELAQVVTRTVPPPRPTTPCEEWRGRLSHLGYGVFDIDGRGLPAHRAAWMTANGPIPRGMKVLHACDNRACIRLDHLWLGTQADNMADMVAKGRDRRNLGGRKSRYPEEMQRQAANEPLTIQATAQKYGVNHVTIMRWRRKWRGVA